MSFLLLILNLSDISGDRGSRNQAGHGYVTAVCKQVQASIEFYVVI